jgi:fermentation-respiration switch protein FrsA (DUF1100 family)
MAATLPTSFTSSGLRCAAWVTRPDGDGPHPGIVLVRGFGATHDMKLPQYEQAFARAGIITLAFDFAHLGASEGTPRQLISLRRQLRDVDAAIDFLAHQPGVDPQRIGLWGTSLGATHVLLTTVRRHDIKAVVIQGPIVNASRAARNSGVRSVARLVAPITSDVIRAGLRLRRRYIQLVGEPGERAAVTEPGAKAGWYSMVAPGHEFDNRVAAAAGAELILSNAARKARRIEVPLLVCLPDRETLIPPRLAVRVAQRAPRGEARHYDGDHFQVYHSPLADQLIGDQVTFMTDHLRTAPPRP